MIFNRKWMKCTCMYICIYMCVCIYAHMCVVMKLERTVGCGESDLKGCSEATEYMW